MHANGCERACYYAHPALCFFVFALCTAAAAGAAAAKDVCVPLRRRG